MLGTFDLTNGFLFYRSDLNIRNCFCVFFGIDLLAVALFILGKSLYYS